MGFPGGSDSKESTCNKGDLGSIPGLERSPGGGQGNPLQYSYLVNPIGQRSLVGYSPWGGKESGVTEQLTLVLQKLTRLIKSCLFIFAFISFALQSSPKKILL